MLNNLEKDITPFGTFVCHHCLTTGGRGGLLWLIFAGYVPLASQSPYAIIVYSVATNSPPPPAGPSPGSATALLFTYTTNIVVHLLTVIIKNFLTPKIKKCATPF